MTKYTLLNRRMNEIRLSYRQAIVIAISTFIAFIYALSRNGSSSLCNESSAINKNVALNEENLPIIYAITPTYYRPVQKAELTRFAIFHYLIWCDMRKRFPFK